MESKMDMQLQLLQEMDEICSKNNLTYILIGKNGLNAYLNHTIKNAATHTSVAMTRGDIDRFFSIIENEYSEDRYVERFEGKNNLAHITYGNINTTDLNMLNVKKQLHHGIHIKIFPIYQFKTKKGKEISDKILEKQVTRKKTSQNKLLNKTYGLLDATTTGYYIDKWIHIQKFSQVRIINTIFDSEILSNTVKIDVDGAELAIVEDAERFFYTIYGKNFRDKKIKPSKESNNKIVKPNKPYEHVLNEIDDIIIEINELNDEIEKHASDVKNEKSVVLRIWKLAQMTDEQIKFKDYFEDKIDYLSTLDLNDEKQFDEVYMELNPAIHSLKKYSRHGMTFSIDKKTDSLIERILLMKNNESLVEKIKELSQKEYFIE